MQSLKIKMEQNKIKFEVPGQPQHKQRPRWSKTRMYSPIQTVNYEIYIKEMFVISYPDFVPLEGALRMTIIAYMMIPKSTSKKRMKLMIDRIIRPITRVDTDNIIKITFDALEKLAYKNDNQITTVICHKYYAIRPRLEIEITGAQI